MSSRSSSEFQFFPFLFSLLLQVLHLWVRVSHISESPLSHRQKVHLFVWHVSIMIAAQFSHLCLLLPPKSVASIIKPSASEFFLHTSSPQGKLSLFCLWMFWLVSACHSVLSFPPPVLMGISDVPGLGDSAVNKQTWLLPSQSLQSCPYFIFTYLYIYIYIYIHTHTHTHTHIHKISSLSIHLLMDT